MATDLSEINETLERIRLEKYPALPAGLVTAILETEAENQEKSQRKQALLKTRSAINDALAVVEGER